MILSISGDVVLVSHLITIDLVAEGSAKVLLDLYDLTSLFKYLLITGSKNR